MTNARPVPKDGFFYQSIDLPDLPTIMGQWDLRANVQAYLGGIALAGKRVLELGAANGYLSFYMERQGASVIPYDLSPNELADVMRYPGLNQAQFEAKCRSVVAGLNKAWWYGHDALASSLTLHHGTVYEIPEALGPFDVATFGSILQHLRDPYSALASAARITRERIVVTDLVRPPVGPRPRTVDSVSKWWAKASRTEDLSGMIFNPTLNADPCVWWSLSAEAVQPILAAVGFSKTTVTYHQQLANPGLVPWGATPVGEYKGVPQMANFFTIVAERG